MPTTRTSACRRSRCCGPTRARSGSRSFRRIAERLPVVALGEYDPRPRRGPAYWIRCVVARTIDAGLPDGPPIVYLPGVSRSELRAADTCPPELAPIAELQYRSQWFSHPNNRDWTVRALLTNSERGLGLRIADDADTSNALLLALDRLLDEPVDRLAKQVIDADLLLELVNEDPVGSLLRWLDDPHGFQAHADSTRVDGVCPAVQVGLRLRPGYRRRDHRRPQARRAAGPVGERLEAVRGDARPIPGHR